MRAKFLLLAMCLLTAATVQPLLAQRPGLEIVPRHRDTHHVVLKNDVGMRIIVKMAHPAPNVGNYRYVLGPGERLTQNFLGGDRALIVWDRRGRFEFAAPVTVDRSGLLVIRPPYRAFPADAGQPRPAEAERGASSPRAKPLKIVPDREQPGDAKKPRRTPRGRLEIERGERGGDR